MRGMFLLDRVNGEDARRTMPWHRREEWDTATLATYSDLARLRRSYAALRRGSLRWAHVDDDTIAYVRELDEQRLLVVARRAPGEAFELPGVTGGSHLLGTGTGGADLAGGDGTVVVPAAGTARLDVWLLA
jgi:alpha-glucosidase